jgi:hypothetical protein
MMTRGNEQGRKVAWGSTSDRCGPVFRESKGREIVVDNDFGMAFEVVVDRNDNSGGLGQSKGMRMGMIVGTGAVVGGAVSTLYWND